MASVNDNKFSEIMKSRYVIILMAINLEVFTMAPVPCLRPIMDSAASKAGSQNAPATDLVSPDSNEYVKITPEQNNDHDNAATNNEDTMTNHIAHTPQHDIVVLDQDTHQDGSANNEVTVNDGKIYPQSLDTATNIRNNKSASQNASSHINISNQTEESKELHTPGDKQSIPLDLDRNHPHYWHHPFIHHNHWHSGHHYSRSCARNVISQTQEDACSGSRSAHQVLVNIKPLIRFIHDKNESVPAVTGTSLSKTGFVQSSNIHSSTVPVSEFIHSESELVHLDSGYVQPGSGFVRPAFGLENSESGLVHPVSGSMHTKFGLVHPDSGLVHTSTGLIHPVTSVHAETISNSKPTLSSAVERSSISDIQLIQSDISRIEPANHHSVWGAFRSLVRYPCSCGVIPLIAGEVYHF